MNTPKCFDVCINNLQYIFGKVITRFLKSIEEKKKISTSTEHELVILNSTQKKNMLTNQAIWQI
jgi:hypothetical protein